MPPQTWLIAYDIADPKRLRRVERKIAAVGQRIHNSLFLCNLTQPELAQLQRRVARLILAEQDIVQYAPWCAHCHPHTQHLGTSAEPTHASAWVI
ncbi:CRISPR-associated endonuclease Cas2 [Propionivibrio sp.]|uniref:CRISPR-associated endonuclease Cas2 n=1 Tax=Propionivibrio sp. TaxID=2212460 RepID=UPI003BF2A589